MLVHRLEGAWKISFAVLGCVKLTTLCLFKLDSHELPFNSLQSTASCCQVSAVLQSCQMRCCISLSSRILQ